MTLADAVWSRSDAVLRTMADAPGGRRSVRYTAYTWDHQGDCWEFDAEAETKWELRPIIRRLRCHYGDCSFLVVRGTATERGFLARESTEVNGDLIGKESP